MGFGVTLTLLKTVGGPLTNPALHYGVSAATFVGCPHLQRLAGGKWSSHGKKEMAYLRQEEDLLHLNVVYIRTLLLEFGFDSKLEFPTRITGTNIRGIYDSTINSVVGCQCC